MTRIDRLNEYTTPMKGPQGAGRDQKNIDYWSDRATDNSNLAPRATGIDETLKPHSTGRTMDNRSTSMSPRTSRRVDAAMKGEGDLNQVGSSQYMAGIRRTT